MEGNKNCSPVKKQRSGTNCEPPAVFVYVVPCILIILSYANSLQGPFLHDDIFAIKLNHDVTGQTALSQVFTNDFWGAPMDNPQSHKSYRPLCTLSFRSDFYMSGGNPVWFHIVNTFLHLCVTLVITGTCMHVLHCSHLHALIASSLFATHPIHTEAVTGLVGRADVLAALLFLASFCLYSRCTILNPVERRNENNNRAVEMQMTLVQWVTFLASMVLAGLAMLSKETGFTVLPMCVLYDILCHGREITRCVNTRRCSSALKYVALRSSLVIVTTLMLLFSRMWIMNFEQPIFTEEANPAAFSPLLTRFLTYSYLPVFNLWLLLNPSHLCYDWSGDSLTLVSKITDRRNFISLTFYSAAAFLVWRCSRNWWKASKDTEKEDVSDTNSAMSLMSIGLMVIPFLPASNLFFPVGFVVAERILYIPSIGFCLLVTHGLLAIHPKLSKVRGQMLLAGIVVLVALLAIKTWDRNKVWDSRRSLYRSGVNTLLQNAKLHYNMGNLLKDEGDKEVAEQHYRIAIQLCPNSASYHLNLGTLVKNVTEAEQCFREALRLKPKHAGAMVNLGSLLISQKDDRGLKLLKEALDNNPDHLEGLLATAYYFADKQNLTAAEYFVRRAMDLRPDKAETHLCYAHYLHKRGELDEALKEYAITLELNPREEKALLNKAILLTPRGQHKEAENLLKRALTLNENCTDCLKQLAKVQREMGNVEEALGTITYARTLAPNDTVMTLRYAQMLKENKYSNEAWTVLEELLQRKPEDLVTLDFTFNFAMEEGKTVQAIPYGIERIKAAVKAHIGDKRLSVMHRDLAEAYRLNGALDSSEQAYAEAVKLNPTFVEAIINLGSILFTKKNYTQAEKYYKQALEIDCNNELANNNLQKLQNILAGEIRSRR